MKLPSVLEEEISRSLGQSILHLQGVTGGDINQACLIHTINSSFFLKYNKYPNGGEILATESRGLYTLLQTEVCPIPRVHGRGQAGPYHFLLLDNWSNQSKASNFWTDFGKNLAHLHLVTAPLHGLPYNNFIGPFKQDNTQLVSWPDFYWLYRLEPLLKKAMDQGLLEASDHKKFQRLSVKLNELAPRASAALLHGDLWSGNYIIAPNGQAALIDPAIYYGHRETDIAMTRLFGGFPDEFYRAYHEGHPLDSDWEERIKLWQLYPLLVHVNLFGGGYVNAVRRSLSLYI